MFQIGSTIVSVAIERVLLAAVLLLVSQSIAGMALYTLAMSTSIFLSRGVIVNRMSTDLCDSLDLLSRDYRYDFLFLYMVY